MREDNQSLSHTTYNCKYHIVFGLCQVILGKFFKSPKFISSFVQLGYLSLRLVG